MALAKRKLKHPDAPISMRPKAEIALAAKKIELNDYRERHKAAVAAQLLAEGGCYVDGVMQRGNPEQASIARSEKRKAAFKEDRAQQETELLAVQARAERAKSREAATEWESAQRDRARLVIALRAANREIAKLRQQGVTGPVDLAYQPGGLIVWDYLLLGHSGNVGLNGAAARGYLKSCFEAGLISRAELAEDDA